MFLFCLYRKKRPLNWAPEALVQDDSWATSALTVRQLQKGWVPLVHGSSWMSHSIVVVRSESSRCGRSTHRASVFLIWVTWSCSLVISADCRLVHSVLVLWDLRAVQPFMRSWVWAGPYLDVHDRSLCLSFLNSSDLSFFLQSIDVNLCECGQMCFSLFSIHV